jgi:hypothetical protein
MTRMMMVHIYCLVSYGLCARHLVEDSCQLCACLCSVLFCLMVMSFCWIFSFIVAVRLWITHSLPSPLSSLSPPLPQSQGYRQRRSLARRHRHLALLSHALRPVLRPAPSSLPQPFFLLLLLLQTAPSGRLCPSSPSPFLLSAQEAPCGGLVRSRCKMRRGEERRSVH